MAKRPIFLSETSGFRSELIDFEFFSGFSMSQKQKSISSLHKNILKKYPNKKILEVSTKSLNRCGIDASAFNLMITMKSGKHYSVEQVFQGSKTFEKSGNQISLLDKLSSKDMKKKVNALHRVEKLIGFNSFGQEFPLNPSTFFYNCLYINALVKNKELSKKIIQYDVFTDIEFNPNNSVNCQAEACSIFVFLKRHDLLQQALKSKESFLKIVYPNYSSYEIESSDLKRSGEQISLFNGL